MTSHTEIVCSAAEQIYDNRYVYLALLMSIANSSILGYIHDDMILIEDSFFSLLGT